MKQSDINNIEVIDPKEIKPCKCKDCQCDKSKSKNIHNEDSKS